VERGVLSPAQSVRCVAAGLANDKAKPLFWRREEWTVPARLLDDAEAAAVLVVALTAAEEGSKAVYAASSRFCEVLKDGFKEVRDRAMAAYWAALEPEFRRFLAALGAGEAQALSSWSAALVASARAAYRAHTGDAQRRTARQLEARVAGESMLDWKLRALRIDEEGEVANGVA
jgi:CRISPR-associated protein Cse1 family